VGGESHAPATLPPERDQVPIVQEVGWARGSVWTGAENIAFHRDSILGPSSPQRVAISTQLSYSWYLEAANTCPRTPKLGCPQMFTIPQVQHVLHIT
jgi:hypothetical protein